MQSLSVNRIGRVFQTYRTQERIADLNRQANLRTVQSPADRVSLSAKARALADARRAAPPEPEAPPAPATEPAPEPATPADAAAAEFTPLFET